jgi:hypothetical protein
MFLKKKCRSAIYLAVLIFLTGACATYESQVMPFKAPSAYANATETAGATIAAKVYDNEQEAKSAFGFDIMGAGIMPVQIIFDNRTHPLEIVPQQTFLLDAGENLWPILDSRMVYDRIERKTELGRVIPEGAKTGLLAGAAGAILGAAIGIVTGHSVAETAAKGAVIGAAGGSVIGGTRGASETMGVQQQISEDIQKRSLSNRAIPAREVSHGFIFFPGEAKKAKELRLQIREVDTGRLYNLRMRLD